MAFSSLVQNRDAIILPIGESLVQRSVSVLYIAKLIIHNIVHIEIAQNTDGKTHLGGISLDTVQLVDDAAIELGLNPKFLEHIENLQSD